MSRIGCHICLRPVNLCYCSALVTVASQIKVLIIQHPLEQKHPFNTGRIAHLCLSNSELLVEETFSDSTLDKILSLPSALLYPSLSWLPAPLNSNEPTIKVQQLIVIDATWRKSKKILHLNPKLQELPRLSLSGNLKSNYQIRKTSMVNGLSTVESIVKAMQILAPDNQFHLMLKPFEKMIALQQFNSKEGKMN